MSTTPEITGYTFGEQLLDHPLAGVWRGEAASGMEVVALVLSETGSADQTVRERLAEASRTAAIEPGEAEVPLWAANLSATRPYAITQLAPGYSGAERLLDPLDGVIGNDQSAIEEVRRRLDGDPATTDDHAEGPKGKAAGRKLWAVAVIVPLVVFIVAYSVGAAVNTAAAEPEPTAPKVPVPDAVQPNPIPSKKIMLPGIPKAGTVPLRNNVPQVPVVTSRDTTALLATQWENLGLPFAMHIPGKTWQLVELEESSYSIYRQMVEIGSTSPAVQVGVAAHPCTDLADCLADRAEFDSRWSKRLGGTPAATARDGQTWFSERAGTPYVASMTRAFRSPATKSWWLVGATVQAEAPTKAGLARAVLNDIRTQTS